MDQLIPLINELHDVFSRVDIPAMRAIELPQIAVVGSQSSGKSSVLEALVGKDFLPRGSGIVTRRPLILQLIQLFPRDGSAATAEWGEFLHKPGVKFHDFQEIRREIESETDAVAGKNKNISPVPITLKVYSPNVLTLTLIDLPGLVRNPVGDQPKDIEQQVYRMVMEYVKQPNTIILAVHPANTDLATSDGIQIAQKVDKEGMRTLGVLTKLDLMDPGTDASDILEGRLLKLRRGFVGVVNRGQRDLDNKKTAQEASRAELDFFSTHPVYKRFVDHCGTTYLAKTLSAMLLGHIREILPALRTKIDELLKLTTAEILKYGGEGEGTMDNSAMLLQLLTQFSNAVGDSINGRRVDAPRDELYGGARINSIFHDRFVPHIGSISPVKDLTDDQIRMAVYNSQGNRTMLFPSQQAFEALLQDQIKRLENPCMRCVEFVYDELVRISDQCAQKCDRYPNLRRELFKVTVDLLQSYKPMAEEHLKCAIASETAYINTNHPDFGDAVTILQQCFAPTAATGPAPAAPPQPTAASAAVVARGVAVPFEAIPGQIRCSGALTDKEVKDHRAIRSLIDSYFRVVKKTIQDQTPKVVTFFLVNKLQETIRDYLVAQLYKPDLIAELLKESDEVATRRKAAHQMHKCLTAAKEVLNKVRDARIEQNSR